MALRVYVGVFEPETAARTAEALRPLVEEGLISITGDDLLRSELGLAPTAQAGLRGFGGAQVIAMFAGGGKAGSHGTPMWLYVDAQRQSNYGARVVGFALGEDGSSVLRDAGIRLAAGASSTSTPYQSLQSMLKAIASQGRVFSLLQEIAIGNIGPFERAELSFCEGINVLIGANATGKSTLLKLLYGPTRYRYLNSQLGTPVEPQHEAPSLEYLCWPFWGPAKEPASRLIRVGTSAGDMTLRWTGNSLELSIFRNSSSFSGALGTSPVAEPVFLPAHEVLSLTRNSLSWLDAKTLPMDGTYYDLCRTLSRVELPPDLRPTYTETLLGEIAAILGGQPQQRGDGSFYLVPAEGKTPLIAELLAEGLRKIATLYRLIEVGALSPGSILFWDEPEANLNPALMPTVIRVLQILANNGVQVFVATHDYLFLYRLGMEARYPDIAHHGVAYRFFSLTREGTGPVDVQQADRLEDLEHNLILEANELFFDERRRRAAEAEEKEG